ncbi:interferon-induced protein 44 isoform X2 [Salmo salar]|nr:interferon-induced protein 44-like isoform X2 [Salmo salar]|eukprot:XP_014058583.1 PREDICTED: interferon-induced protein 44-like [Salmo salar]
MQLFKSTTPPMPTAAFDKEWRITPWGQKEVILQKLKDYVPGNPDIKSIRVFLHGPVGAGKSSLINFINSVFQGRITSIALADSAIAAESFTIKYQTHKIEKGKHGIYYPIVFNDVMGLEESSGKGVHKDDIINALKGHVKEGHKFNPMSPLSEEDPGYIKIPSSEDRVHCLVSVMPADKMAFLGKHVIQKMRDIRLAAADMGIPQMVVLTRVDEACPSVRKDVKNIYLSKYIKEKMEQCSTELGVPVNCILPVKNYHEEIDLNEDMDVLLLRALRQMVDFADDFIKNIPLKITPQGN